MQMVERPWGVAAYGAAGVKAMPDLVRVRFKVVRLEQTPSESFARASGSVHAVREVLRRLACLAACIRRCAILIIGGAAWVTVRAAWPPGRWAFREAG